MTTKQSEFLAIIKPMIIADMRKTGILASLTAAQAIFESGWGKDELAVEANNLFGMKGSYKGESIVKPTKEWVNGQYVTVNAAFRKYPSWIASIDDHSEKFLTMQRYANLRGCTDYKLACRYVYEDGYATAPDYTQKLIRAIEQYDLSSWDAEALTGANTGAREAMTKSSLTTSQVDFGTKKSNPRTQKVTKITIHCMAGNMVAEACARYHLTCKDPVSANYYVGTDGAICAGVSENRRAWTSSSEWNDQRAITIEVANNGGAPDYPVSDAAYKATIALCADICKRYGITPHYDGTKNASLTEHRMYAAKSCPGAYLHDRLASGQIARDIMTAMGSVAPVQQEKTQQTSSGKVMYRVQVGAFKSKTGADNYLRQLNAVGINGFVRQSGNMYKVQVGAFAQKSNATAQAERLKASGYNAFVTSD